MHPFEKAELGKAPFKFVGCENRVGPIQLDDGITTIGAPGQPMGTCQYCGQGIALCMRIKSADGKYFTVGSDCVAKLYRDSNIPSTEQDRDPVCRAIKQAKLDHNRKVRHAREAIALEAAKEWAHDNKAVLKSMPSMNRPGETLWDRFEWFWVNAGTKGKLELISRLKERVNKCSTTT